MQINLEKTRSSDNIHFQLAAIPHATRPINSNKASTELKFTQRRKLATITENQKQKIKAKLRYWKHT